MAAYLNALLNELRALGATVIFTEETSKALGPEIEVRVEGISALVENIILLDYVDVGSELRRLLSVIKQRGGGFEDKIRELRITDGARRDVGDGAGDPCEGDGAVHAVPGAGATRPDRT